MTSQNPILWLDTETGGFDPKAHDLLTTGLLLSIAGRSVQTWSHTIQRNEYRVTQSALETNRLNPDDLRRDGRPLSEVDAE